MHFAKFAESLGLSDDEIGELIELFLETSRPEVEAMLHAAEDGDAEQVAALAHSLKGAGLNFELGELAASAARIEAEARAGSLAHVTTRTRVIEQELDRVARMIGPAGE